MYVDRKGTKIRRLFPLEIALNIHINLKDLQFPKPYHVVKSEKHEFETVFVCKVLIWRQKWVAGNSPVSRRVSPGRIIVVFFWKRKNKKKNHAVPGQIQSGILKLTIRKGESNFNIALIFVSRKKRGYSRFVSAVQLSFDCLSYLGAAAVCEGCHRSFQLCPTNSNLLASPSTSA